MSPQPLFLLSLPRAGSTLVQRVIAAHPRVATTSEPWLLLPLLYSLRERQARAEYGHIVASRAIVDFCATLPGGEAEYRQELASLAGRLYASSAGGADYFLDKTPRYHLVADQIAALFPQAKLVFLWRNPLGVVSSLVETFRQGRWEPHLWRIDLFDGIVNLTDAYRACEERALGVRYEDLLTDDAAWRRLFGYLDLEFEPRFLDAFTEVELRGRFGDPTGVQRYGSLEAAPIEKWRASAGGLVRRRWCRRYLEWIGRERLALMGYELDGLLAGLKSLPARPWSAPVDAIHLAASRRSDGRRRRALEVDDGPQPIGPPFAPRPTPRSRLGRLRRRAGS